MSDKLYIVIPAYNEEANIESVINQWHAIIEKTGIDSRLIIVNDGSKDKTFEIMQALAKKYAQFIPLTKSNSGHGASCLFAYQYALNVNADYIFQTDSDGQTNPDEFWQFWEKRNNFDFIIGKRDNRQDGFDRVIVTNVLRLTIYLIFGERITDANTPFRLMKSERLTPILKIIPENFFLSNVVISTIAVKWKESCIWLPITFKPRQGGLNSINLTKIFKIGLKAIRDFRMIKKLLHNE